MNKDAVHKFIQDVLRVQNEMGRFPNRPEYESKGKYGNAIALLFGNWSGVERAIKREKEAKDEERDPKILVFDIETRPLTALIWRPKTDYVGHDNITDDRTVLSFAAKWIGKKEIIYHDQRGSIGDDSGLLGPLSDLLTEADIVVTKNGKRFDKRVVFGRLALNGMRPPRPFKDEDIEELFRKHFDLPYYNMDYLSQRFCKKHKKSKHKKFPGILLWKECLRGNTEAWDELAEYNKKDVLVTEELRGVIQPWGPTPTIDYNVFHGGSEFRCRCGSTDIIKRGFSYTKTGKYPQFSCKACGAWFSKTGQGNSVFSEKKKMSLKGPG